MASHDTPPPRPNPAEIAREAFIRLAKQRIAPTPDNYREVYNDIVGIAAESSAETVLSTFASQLSAMPGAIGTTGQQLAKSVKARDWTDYSSMLTALGKSHLLESVDNAVASTTAKKPTGAISPAIKATVAAAATPTPAPADVDIQVRILREMLTRTLGYAVPPLLVNAPDLVTEAETLAAGTKEARTEVALLDVAARLKKLCFKLDTKGSDLAEQQELLLRLFRLLLENVGELVEDDSWLHGQIDAVHRLLDGPITHLALKDATASLKEVIYKQGLLKHSLSDAKITVKSMMMTFIDRVGAMAISTGDYHQKIDQYSRKITVAQDVKDLNGILEDVMRDTRSAQDEALRSRDQMVNARQEMQEAENRIQYLESQLEKMSELVREDQLTGSLNRRGLDDVFERELARVDRQGGTLCIAMLDLDDFKRLNDTHGHVAGDEALVHLVGLVKETLRTMDVVGRFGGEEFLIILPDTQLEAATQTITRLQRELTKRIFMVNHERLLITFSAGVALRMPGEDAVTLIRRADGALYAAKKAGKNRVAIAP
ncbi:MAG: GGDEF domain-containing protein [Pseudomonadota bacterium]